MSDPFVVKVQRSLNTSDGVQRVLMYDDSGDIVYETEMTDELAKVVTQDKQYFWATLEGTVVNIVPPALDNTDVETPHQMFKNYTYPVMNQSELIK